MARLKHVKRKIKVILISLFTVSISAVAYADTSPLKIAIDTIPPMLYGNFVDDYGIRYTISDTLWTQLPNVKYHIISWNIAEQYLLIRNDDKNPSEAGLYTRIDYMNFSDMEPFLWGFCLTVYNAKTMDEARTKSKADRQNPRKGCAGYPFSRMKRID